MHYVWLSTEPTENIEDQLELEICMNPEERREFLQVLDSHIAYTPYLRQTVNICNDTAQIEAYGAAIRELSFLIKSQGISDALLFTHDEIDSMSVAVMAEVARTEYLCRIGADTWSNKTVLLILDHIIQEWYTIWSDTDPLAYEDEGDVHE